MLCAIIYLLENISVASTTNSLGKKGLEGEVCSPAPAGNHGGTAQLRRAQSRFMPLSQNIPQQPKWKHSEQSPLKAQQQSKQMNKSSWVHPRTPTGIILSASALHLIPALAYRGVKKTPTKHKPNLHENQNPTTKPSHTTTTKLPKPA